MEVKIKSKLIDISLLDVEFHRTSGKVEPGSTDVGVEIDLQSSYDKENNLIRTIVKMSLTGDNLPYTFSFKIGGAFTCDGKISDEEVEAFSKETAIQTIFPFAREFVAYITAKGLHTPQYLPFFEHAELDPSN